MVREPESSEECKYFSNRATDLDGNKFCIWVFKDTPEEMNVRYTCGNCKNQGIITDEYGLPYKIECEKCGTQLKVVPLRGAAKGAKKKKKVKKIKKVKEE